MRLNESAMQSHSLHPSDAVQGFGISQQVFCNAKMFLYRRKHCLQEQRIVYTSALLADTVKPLNVLSKFENHFAIRTVRFQVQLEAGGYFSAQKFSNLQPQQAGRVGANSQVLNQIFQIRLQKRLLGFAKTRYSAHKLCRLRILTDAE